MRPTRRAAAQLPLGRPLRERPRRRPGLGRADAGLPRHGAAVAAAGPGAPTPSRSTTPTAHILETEELTILTGWAEGVAEAAAYAPERIDAVLAAAHADATWRAEFGLPRPSRRNKTRPTRSALLARHAGRTSNQTIHPSPQRPLTPNAKGPED